ncbi:ATP synthase regulation protein NCA2-domain-containing protein [Paraphysoderma sedebokerense]|nr:ATP synthase regulation protein NCA2-domain-containing protein [Paraphysoderma sedebokerense]
MEKVLAKHTELSRVSGTSINISDLKDAETSSILTPPKLSSTLLDILAQLTTTPTSIPVTTQTTTRILIRYGRPSFLTRYWIPFTISFVSGYLFVSTMQLNREKMIQWSEDLAETVINGFKEWIWKPILEVWETVRHKESRIAVVGRESLNSDLESLERMVLNYVNAHKTLRTLSPDEIHSILYQTRQGDIGVVMREYESEVLHPLSSTITGHLPTLLLIQIQKTKVDLALALSALDKLLRSNELNFSVLAVLPVLVLLGGGISWFRRLIRQWSGKGREKGLKKVRSVLIEVEKLVNRGRAMIGEEVEEGDKSRNKEQETMKEEELGLLLIELHYLRSLLSPSSPNSALSLSKTEVEQHLDDIRELETTSYTVEMKLRVVDRIWRSWDL